MLLLGRTSWERSLQSCITSNACLGSQAGPGKSWLTAGDDELQVHVLQAGGLGAGAPDAPEPADGDAPGALVCEVAAPQARTGQAHVSLWPLLLLRNELPRDVHYRQLAAAADGAGVCQPSSAEVAHSMDYNPRGRFLRVALLSSRHSPASWVCHLHAAGQVCSAEGSAPESGVLCADSRALQLCALLEQGSDAALSMAGGGSGRLCFRLCRPGEGLAGDAHLQSALS